MGYMMVAAGNDNLFRRLCAAIGRPGLAEEADFARNADRVVNRRGLVPILTDIFATEPMAVWVGAARCRRVFRTARSRLWTRW